MKLKRKKFLVDENLGVRVPKFLRNQGFDVVFIREMNLLGVSDIQVFTLANQEDRIIITSDKQFEAIFKEGLVETGVILLMLKDESVANKKKFLLKELRSKQDFHRKFTVVTDQNKKS